MDLQAATALAFARERLAGAAAEVDDLRAQARALTAATAWTARAAEAYRAALQEWSDRLDALAVGIALCESELAARIRGLDAGR